MSHRWRFLPRIFDFGLAQFDVLSLSSNVLLRYFLPVGLVIALSPCSRARSQVSTVTDAVSSQHQSFDVASIRESSPTPPYRQYLSNPPRKGTFDATDMWMTQIIAAAYDVNFRNQVVEYPDWVATQRFTIHAKSGVEVDRWLEGMSEDQAKEQKRVMLRSLLADRFGLKAHVEPRSGTVYTLTFLKSSPGLREVPSTDPSADHTFNISSQGDATRVKLTGHAAPMPQLIELLSYYLKSQVFDQTGLTGRYDFQVYFSLGQDQPTESQDVPPPAEVALQEQTGLKLVRGKGPVKTIVVDAIAKPSPN